METIENENELKIPENTSDRDEIISGFGKTEFLAIGLSVVCSIALLVFVYLLTRNLPLGFVIAIAIIAVTIVVVMKDKYGENMVDKMKILFRYLRMQKKYQYQRYDVFGEVEDE